MATASFAEKGKQNFSTLPDLPEYQLSTENISKDLYESSAKAKFSESEKSKRKIALSDTIDEKGFLSPSYILVRDEFLAVKNPEQLDVLVIKYSNSENMAKLDRDGQFLALQLAALKPYKSFYFRAKGYLGKNTAIRSFVVTSLKTSAKAQQVFNPTQEQKAVFDYVTTPVGNVGSSINTDRDLENYIANEVLSSAVSTYNAYVKILKSASKPIHWDNKVMVSFATFADSADRFVQIDLPEQFLMMAALEQAVAGVLLTSAYSLDGFSDMVKRMSNEFGIDVVTPGVEGISSKKRFQILAKYPSLFNLKQNGDVYTKAAYGFIKAAYLNSKVAWKFINQNPQGNAQTTLWLNPQTLLPFSRQINASLNNFDFLFSNEQMTSAVVNGEKVNINFQKIFSEPPKSLSSFYPTQFNSEPEFLEKEIKGTKYRYRNYLTESSVSWSYAEYSRYMPDVRSTDKKNTDVSRELRVLSQVWGANILGFSLASFVF